MDRERLQRLLESVRDRETDVPDALRALRDFPYESLGFANVDHHRTLRQGIPEAVFCEGKTAGEVVAIVQRLTAAGGPVVATRASAGIARAIRKVIPRALYHPRSRVVVIDARRPTRAGTIAVVTAGTADLPVAEEAAVTASALGNRVETVYDVGVAGVHRVFDRLDRLRAARVLVVVAGMDGVLPSLVGGLVRQPVVAVPTSCGYGAHFNGLAPLLTMLNACAAGVAVVNIDNGFGAGVLADRINAAADGSTDEEHGPRRNGSVRRTAALPTR